MKTNATLEATKNPVHFSSDRQDWETPQAFFDMLDAEFRFQLDVCALPHNAKCDQYFTPEDDGLAQTWHGVCWMNPPYGQDIADWVRKAYEETRSGDAFVVALVPARTDTAWWHDYVMKAAEVRLVRGRLRFVGAESSAPFPSSVVVWYAGYEGLPVFKAMERGEMA